MPEFIGLLPAAGMGSRLAPFSYPKELMPIAFRVKGEDKGAHPRLAIEFSIEALKAATVKKAIVVISDRKVEIMRCLGNGARHGMDLCYIHQESAEGLADAVDRCYEWTKDNHVCLALPDTIINPGDAFKQVCESCSQLDSDVQLGVFPTDTPERFGPVRHDAAGQVIEVIDKPARTDLRGIWGIAAWSPRFSKFVHETLAARPEMKSLSIGLLFNEAITAGLKVRANFFESGSYLDLGDPSNIGSLIFE
ncbi:MAG: hypothetical protein K1X53_06645 [Candidatus Sumerlaeaceae bacterium]|nr:hypothetical protein [Candidatus Sumerlaeaceae bacterium]